MKVQEKTKPYKRIALIVSLCALIIWSILGTGASLAWFADSSPEIENIFHFADFQLEVSHLKDGRWEKIDGQTKIFDENALYEPGYVQVVYLQIKNKGTVPFEFKTAVNVTGYTLATNVFGQQFNLQDHLKFGVITLSEADIMNGVLTRERAKEVAINRLNNYSTDVSLLDAGKTVYSALVIHMPQTVGNVANYTGDAGPKVELGIIVKADQIKK